MTTLTRRERRRNSPEVKAARAATLLDDPNLRAVFDECRNQAIKDLECFTLDGTPENAQKALELIRKLQTLLSVKGTILRPLIQERLRENKLKVN
jgi:hypothetical protein